MYIFVLCVIINAQLCNKNSCECFFFYFYEYLYYLTTLYIDKYILRAYGLHNIAHRCHLKRFYMNVLQRDITKCEFMFIFIVYLISNDF